MFHHDVLVVSPNYVQIREQCISENSTHEISNGRNGWKIVGHLWYISMALGVGIVATLMTRVR